MDALLWARGGNGSNNISARPPPKKCWAHVIWNRSLLLRSAVTLAVAKRAAAIMDESVPQ